MQGTATRGTCVQLVSQNTHFTFGDQRRRIACLALLRQGPATSGGPVERPVSHCCACRDLRPHLLRVYQVRWRPRYRYGCFGPANMFTSAFNAIVSASVVLLGVAYAIPIAINCMRGRKMLPPRPFELPPLLGWTCNIVCGLSLIFRLCAR